MYSIATSMHMLFKGRMCCTETHMWSASAARGSALRLVAASVVYLRDENANRVFNSKDERNPMRASVN